MAKASRKKKLDFTGVETFNKPAEGSHKVKVTKVEEVQSQGGNDMFKVVFEVVSGPSKGCRVVENYPLIDTALWKLKSLLQAINIKAEGRVQIDLDKMEGKILEIKVVYEDYQGQERARVAETNKFIEPAEDDDDDEDNIDEEDEAEDDDEEEEEPKPVKKTTRKTKTTSKSKTTTKKKSAKKEEPEEEPEDEDDDWDDDDDDDDWDDED